MESNNTYGHVYRMVNDITDKVYIGVTTLKNPRRRFKKHGYCAKYGRDGYLYNSIRKHGLSNFSFEVIAKANSKEKLNLFEKAFIRLFKSHYTEGGYNIDWGGKTKQTSERTRKLMSKAQYDAGTVKAVDKYNLNGKLLDTYGSIHDAAQKNNCSVSHIGDCCQGNALTAKNNVYRYKDESFDKYPIEQIYNNKEVELYDTEGNFIEEYESLTLCAKDIGAEIAAVSSACRGSCYTVNGYVARFQGDDFNKYPIEGKTSAKPVIQIDPDTGEELRKFDTITRAYDHLDKQCNQGISLVCQGRQNTCHGYKWRYT